MVRLAARGHAICILFAGAFVLLLAGQLFLPGLRSMGRAPAEGLIVFALGGLFFQVALIVMRSRSRETFDAAETDMTARRPRHG